jgi:type II secretory pathway component GspD/PulD (secretin)
MRTFCLALAALLTTCTPLQAQEPDPLKRPVSITASSAPLRDTLKMLFQQMGVSFTIPSTITGTVDVELKDVSAQTALSALLKSGDRPLRYVVRDGVFSIEERPADTPPPPAGPPASEPAPKPSGPNFRTITLRHVDGFTLGEILRMSGRNVTLLHPFPLGVLFSPFPGLLNGVGQGVAMGAGLLGGPLGLVVGDLWIGVGGG